MEEYDQNPPKNKSVTSNTCKHHTKRNQQLKILTYNVRTLSSYDRLLELEENLKKINYVIIGISKVRRLGNRIEEYETFVICYIGHTPGQHGVGFIINKSLKNNIESFVGLTERVATLNMNIGGNNISLVQIYAPTDAASEYEIEEFYKTIENALETRHKHTILMGDFNAKVGAPKEKRTLNHETIRIRRKK